MITSSTGPPSTPPRRYLRVQGLMTRYGVSRSTIYRLLDEGAIAQPSGYLTKRTPVWLESDLDKHDDEHLKEGLNNG